MQKPEQTLIPVEVAYALPERQRIIALSVALGCTALQAVRDSGIVEEFPEIDLDSAKMGVFSRLLDGKVNPMPAEYVLRAHDRIELYRPLVLDPKQARLARADKKGRGPGAETRQDVPGRKGENTVRDTDSPDSKDNASGSSGARLFSRIESGLREFYVAPYRQAFARAQRDEDDLFMLMIFSETLGIPNPAAYYTLELLPVVYERFHDWHRRMGMEHSPLDHVQCC